MSTFREISIQIADVYEYTYLFLGIFALLIPKVRKDYSWILFFLLFTGVLRIGSIFMAESEVNSIPIYHLIGLSELVLVYIIYRSQNVLKSWKYVFFLLVGLYLFHSLFVGSIWEMNGLAQATVQLFIFGLSVNYLFELYNRTTNSRKAIPVFFFANAGFMAYAAGSFLVFIINERIIHGMSDDLFDNAWLIEAGFGAIRLIFIGITFRLVNFEK